MTPKEKAKELYAKYYNRIEHSLSEEASEFEKDIVKQCALIAVDEILSSKPNEVYKVYSSWLPASTYWINVKEQIEKL